MATRKNHGKNLVVVGFFVHQKKVEKPSIEPSMSFNFEISLFLAGFFCNFFSLPFFFLRYLVAAAVLPSSDARFGAENLHRFSLGG